MATALDLIAETKRHLGGLQREQMNKLAAPVAPGAGTLLMQYDLGPIQAGAHVQVGLELYYVWSVEQASKTLIVEPAQQGTPEQAHDQGDLVTVNPRFSDFGIFKSLNDEITALSSPGNGLYAVKSIDLTGATTRIGYDLPAEVQEILEIRWQGYNPQSGTWPLVSNYRLARAVDESFTSGATLFLHDGVPPGRQIRVRYRAAFTPLASLASDVATTGLPASAFDIPPMGAAVRLVAPLEIKRNLTESSGDTRRAEEVPPGAVAGSMRAVAALRAQRIFEESAALLQQNGYQQHVPHDGAAWR